MHPDSQHPETDLLRAYALGELDGAEYDRVEAHIRECDTCCLRAADVDLSNDPVLAALRRHAAQQSGAGEASPAGNDASEQDQDTSRPETDPANKEPAGLPEMPPILGPYDVLDEVGHGGMGAVYRGYDPRLERDVAIKVIQGRHLGGVDARKLFRAEAKAAGRLDHSNIVPIYEFEEYDGIAVCVFAYVHGGTLAERIRSSPLDARAAANLVAVLADAVQYAHQEKIVHRDLKPTNILLMQDGTPKIADFGLAKRLDDARPTSLDGMRVGAPSYMSPEQAAGAGASVGPATDIYGLGAILYELLTGRPPFVGKTVEETLAQVQHQDPLPPSRLAPGLDADLEAICLTCLKKSPKDRYNSAAELAADLRRFLGHRPVSVRHSSWLERSRKLVRRRPAESVIAAVLAITLIGFLAYAVWNGGPKQLSDFDRRTAYAVQLQQAATLTGTDPEAALRLLADPERCPSTLQDFTRGYLQSLCQRQRGRWQNGNAVQVLAVAETGDLFASGDPKGTLRLWSADQPGPRWEVPAHRQSITDLRFTRDGQRIIAAGEDGTVSFWILAGKQAEPAWNPAAGPINGIAVSPDGTRLATAHRTGQVRVWELPGKRLVANLTGHTQSVFRVAFNADGRFLASGSKDGTLRIWRMPNGGEIRVPNEDHGYVTDVRFHPRDPNQLATSYNDRTVQQWRISSPDEAVLVRTLRGFSDTVSTVAYSRDGAFLAAGSYDHTVLVWHAETGQLITSRDAYPEGVWSIAFDHAARLLTGTKDGQIERWSVDGTDRTLSIRGHEGPLSGLAFLQGGEAVVSSALDGAVRVWNVEDATQLAQWQVSSDWVAALACSSDRTQFAWECGGTLYRGRFRNPASLTEQELPGLFSARAMAYSQAGDRLIVADETGLHAVDLATGATQWSWSEAEVWRVATSPANDVLAAAGQGDHLWTGPTRTGQLVTRPAGAGGVRSLRFSADGARLAIGGDRGRIVIQHARGGQPELTIETHTGAVLCLAFSPDGKTLATGGEDGEVHLWDPQAGCKRLRLPVGGAVQYLDFSPDGRRLACGTDEGEIRIWRAEY